MKNPLSWLVVAATSWILVLGLNQVWVSLLVIALAQTTALLRLRNLSVLVATLALAIPLSLSLLVVHAPFGSERLAPLITADGLVTAGELGLRFVALMSAFLAAAAMITVPQLAKAVQGGRLAGPRLAYIVGSAVQLLPQGRDAWAAIHDANTLRGRNARGPIRALRNVAVPLITRLLGAGAARAIPVEVAGLDRRGPRTVLRPVAEYGYERPFRWLLPLVAVGVVAWF